VGGRVLVVVGLDLHEHASDTVDEKRRSDQLRRDLVHASREERRAQLLSGQLIER